MPALRGGRPLAIVLLLIGPPAFAECLFDQFGTISNPEAPACRDTQLVYTENDNTGDRIALGYPTPIPVDSLTAIDGFRTYASLLARHQDLMLTQSSVNGAIAGQTRGGRDIWAYRLGDADNLNADGLSEAAVIVNGGIHAREWQSPEVLTEVFEQLVEKSTDTHVGQYLHDNLNVVLLPVLNVDGFIQTQNFPTRATADESQPRDGRMRRKNMRQPAGGIVDEDLDTTGDSFFGVDLNRNSVHGFGQNGGSSNDTVSLVYRGPAHSSEPEILALQAATAMGPAGRLRLGIDVHSFSAVYFTPQTGNTRRDAITRILATRMRAVTNFRYRYSPGPVGSFGIGALDGYFAYQFQIPAYTLEIEPLNGGQDYGGTGVSHSGFVLPDSEIARVRDELAETLLLGFYRQTGPPHLTAAQIRDTADDQVVYAAAWQSGGNTRALSTATNKALVPGHQYELWLAFNKPMRWFDENGMATDYSGQNSETGAIVISSPDAGVTFSASIDLDDSVWQTSPGGAPNGYLQYRGDALRTVFTLPATIASAITGPTAASIQVNLSDLAEMRLDARPQTVADWAGGHWVGYEDSAESASDVGGADCTLITYIAVDANAATPGQPTVCPAKQAAIPPPPTPAPQPAPSSGGGGNGLWLLPLVILVIRRRYE